MLLSGIHRLQRMDSRQKRAGMTLAEFVLHTQYIKRLSQDNRGDVSDQTGKCRNFVAAFLGGWRLAHTDRRVFDKISPIHGDNFPIQGVYPLKNAITASVFMRTR
jgi:hypothetical protein